MSTPDPVTFPASLPTCKLVDRRLWERVLIGWLARLFLVLRGRPGQVSPMLLLLQKDEVKLNSTR